MDSDSALAGLIRRLRIDQNHPHRKGLAVLFSSSSIDPAHSRQDYLARQDRLSAADDLADKQNRFALAPIPRGFQPVAVIGGFELVNEVGVKILAVDGKPFETVEKAMEAGRVVGKQLELAAK